MIKAVLLELYELCLMTLLRTALIPIVLLWMSIQIVGCLSMITKDYSILKHTTEQH